jgi:hypothetical protein
MDRALLCALLLLLPAVSAQAAPPPSTKVDEEFTVTAPRRLWATEEESDAKHRADYERLKQKFAPDKPTYGDAERLGDSMSRPIQQRDSPLRDSMQSR